MRLALESRGNGPAHLLFLHGWISSRRMWYDVTDRLDLEGFTVHLLDFRGCGESDRPSDGHDLDGYTSDARAAIEAVQHPVTIIAHSMGGKVAQRVAVDQPEQLAELVLVGPGSARAYHLDARHRAMTVAAFGSRERIERFQRAAMVRSVAPDVLERLVTDALIAQREHWFGWYDEGRTADFADLLGAIVVPTLIVAGERDPLAPPARMRHEVVEAIRAARMVTLRNTGHNMPVEIPAELADIIARARLRPPHRSRGFHPLT